ncbi:hypothetical protein CYMTET_29586 [Cymbomonas tetramitiformis]|uniref:DOT1 domain-containing protein n=1 Tax=Cymbomonas tetramitiformis TaxID=36881 RepID=A0AAE0FKN8_9CHLO|nr:hypothetical protein CYMTET_29586 [Cymbomonas tetramitiformis]
MVEKVYDGVSPGLESRINKERGYGEITVTGMFAMASALQLDQESIFYDLGSGLGKLVLFAALTCNVRRAVGHEISERRHVSAVAALAHIDSEHHPGISETVCFKQADFTQEDYTDATHVYLASLLYTDDTLVKVCDKLCASPGLKAVLSIRELPLGNPLLRKLPTQKQVSVRCSWDVERATSATLYWASHTE